MTTPTARIFVCLSLTMLAACSGTTSIEAVRNPVAPPPSPETGRPILPATIPLLIDGEPIGWGTLLPLLAESAGRDVVQELTLETALRRELRARGLTITESDLRAERSRWTRLLGQEGLAAEAESAIRLRRGLGPERFNRLLWRNAALRTLIDPRETEVSDEEVRLAVEIRRGTRFAASGVVLPDARSAILVAEQARADARGALAGMWAAAIEQGVQPWHAVLSPHDPATPDSLRQVLTNTPIGSPSDAIALDTGYGVLLVHGELDSTTVAQPIDEQSIHEEIQLRKTRLAMEKLAESLISKTPSHVLDRNLNWHP